MSPPAGVVDGLLAGRYRLVARLGTGGSGEVWRARDERLGRDVAVKVLRPELADDEGVRARFRAEARHAGGLRHPGIAAVFDFAEGEDGAWLVMELVDGEPLSDVLRREGRLPVDRALDVVEQTAAALQAAHQGGVVHRDVKPGNLLVRPDGRLSVTDFGIAHAAGSAALTRTGEVVGTAAYLSPEQASGRPVSPATDLYALGVVLHECLSGARPFERDDPVAVLLAHLQAPPPPLPPDVPAPVAELVHRLLAKEPADRPASASEVQQEAAALRRSLQTPPAAVTGATAVLPTAPATGARSAVLGLSERPGQRRAVRATAVALALLALALGVRDAVRDDPAQQRTPAPASSAPPSPVATQEPAGEEQEPAEQPVVEQPAPVAPQDGAGQGGEGQGSGGQGGGGQGGGGQGGGGEQQPLSEQQRKELEKQQEQARKDLEKQQEQTRKDQEQQQEKGEKGGKGEGGGG